MEAMQTIERLNMKKDHWGFLQGSDAVDFLNYAAADASGEKWTREAEASLTAFMLGLPTKPGYRFEIIAGSPAPTLRHDVVPVIEKPTRTCLGCGRQFVPRRKNQEFHSDDCHIKAGVRASKAGVVPAGWKVCAVCAAPFKPERGNELYCPKSRCSRPSARKAVRGVSETASIAV